MVIVGRAINGIPLNGLEYLIDEKGVDMKFGSRKAAEAFLLKNGVSENELEFFIFKKILKSSVLAGRKGNRNRRVMTSICIN